MIALMKITNPRLCRHQSIAQARRQMDQILMMNQCLRNLILIYIQTKNVCKNHFRMPAKVEQPKRQNHNLHHSQYLLPMFTNKKVSLGEPNVEEGAGEENIKKEESYIIVLKTDNTKHHWKWDNLFVLWWKKTSKIVHHLEDMHNTELEVASQGDDLILKYGNWLCAKLIKDGDQQHPISNKLCELVRLVLETRKCCDSVSALTDCLLLKNFDFVIEVVMDLSGWDEGEGTLSCPSICTKLGHSLWKCSKILQADGIMKGSKSLVNQADNFTTLPDLNWNAEITRIACCELDER